MIPCIGGRGGMIRWGMVKKLEVLVVDTRETLVEGRKILKKGVVVGKATGGVEVV